MIFRNPTPEDLADLILGRYGDTFVFGCEEVRGQARHQNRPELIDLINKAEEIIHERLKSPQKPMVLFDIEVPKKRGRPRKGAIQENDEDICRAPNCGHARRRHLRGRLCFAESCRCPEFKKEAVL